MKKLFLRGTMAFIISAFAAQVIALIILLCSPDKNAFPVLPEFAARFSSPLIALYAQNFLCGFIGTAFAIGNVFLETDKIPPLFKGAIHFVFTSAVWVPIAVICWGLGKYPTSLISTVTSFALTYIATWLTQYFINKKNIKLINDTLKDLTEAENEK